MSITSLRTRIKCSTNPRAVWRCHCHRRRPRHLHLGLDRTHLMILLASSSEGLGRLSGTLLADIGRSVWLGDDWITLAAPEPAMNSMTGIAWPTTERPC